MKKKNKLFDNEDKRCIERVLSLGLSVNNESGDILKNAIPLSPDGEYEIEYSDKPTKEYKSISSALTQFFVPKH